MVGVRHSTKKMVKRLSVQFWTSWVLSLFILSGEALASYESQVNKAAQLWININQQDAFFLAGKISQKKWSKEHNYFTHTFRKVILPLVQENGKLGGNPERFEREFAKAVAKRLGVKYSIKAPLLAIKAAPRSISLNEYRRDIWRAAEIKTLTDNGKAQNPAIRREMVKLNFGKYGGESSPASLMFYRNYTALVIPGATSKPALATGTAKPFFQSWFYLILAGAVILFFLPRFFFNRKLKKDSVLRMEEYGKDPKTRHQNIMLIFDSARSDVFHRVLHKQSGITIDIMISRSLMAMPQRAREALRVIELAYNDGKIDETTWRHHRFGLIYNDGNCSIAREGNFFHFSTDNNPQINNAGDALAWCARTFGLSTEQSVNFAASIMGWALDKAPDSPVVKDVGSKFTGGGGLLTEKDITDSPLYSQKLSDGLLMGILPPDFGQSKDLSPLIVKPQGHLITIAGSGTGKTQCQVLPNLLSYPGSAIVLDVKGDLYEQTSRWRGREGHKVILYDPLDHFMGEPFNPLYFIDGHVEKVQEDALRLATSMITLTGKDPFWDTSAQNVLQAIIVYHCLKNAPEDRHMGEILNLLNTDDVQNVVAFELKDEQYPDSINRLGKALDDIQEKVLQSVITSANAQLNCWGGAVERTTHGKPAWLPTDLQDPANPLTVYITMKSGDPKDYKSVLRVLVDTHFQQLTKEHPSHTQVSPVLIFLDEFGALDRMDSIKDIVNRGRSYGLWLWIFLQSEQQIKELYGNADDFMGNFTVRSYMNPNFPTAERLSKEFGQQASALDGSENPIVRPEELAGNKYRDYIILMGRGEKPALLRKLWTYQSAPLQKRINPDNSDNISKGPSIGGDFF